MALDYEKQSDYDSALATRLRHFFWQYFRGVALFKRTQELFSPPCPDPLPSWILEIFTTVASRTFRVVFDIASPLTARRGPILSRESPA